MIEDFPISLNRKGTNLIISQKYLNKGSASGSESATIETRGLKLTSSSDLFDIKTITPTKKHKKKFKKAQKKKELQDIYDKRESYKKNAENLKTAANKIGTYIERKRFNEKCPEIQRKSLPRSSFKECSSFLAFFSKNKTPRMAPIELSPQISHKLSPRQISAYDSWKMENNIAIESKIFIISGNYPDVRNALLARGWVENNDIKSIYFDLKWARNARIPQNIFDWQLYNHFPRNFELSIKWQLYENIKLTNKVTKANYLNFMPRCFKLDSKGTDEFLETFKAIYAVSLLRDYIENPENIMIEQVIIASIVCKRWIQEIENQKLYGKKILSILVMNVEWKILISKDTNEIKSSFQRMMLSHNQDIYPLIIANLKKLADIDSQYLLNGKKNIWIIKAGRKSRGRDIALFNDLNKLKELTSISNHWVVQKYIENPLVIYHRKFDIRQWVLISNSDPLIIWIYKKSYLRFSLENYNDDNINNPYIHLTNNSISKKSKKFYSSDIKGCMWSIEQFKDYLIKNKGIDIWTLQIFPAIKKIVKYSLLAIGNLGRKSSFEIFGYDFMIDDEYKPWLLEINSSPAMDYSTVIII